jgi:hypothetical protein
VSSKEGVGDEVVKMVKLMKASEYALPDSLGLTPECKALLKALLHPDSAQRITMAGIMADPWFRTDLPPDALTMNDRYIKNTRKCAQSDQGAAAPGQGTLCWCVLGARGVRSKRWAASTLAPRASRCALASVCRAPGAPPPPPQTSAPSWRRRCSRRTTLTP